MTTERAPGPCLCPRCGYNQSGIVATWTEACPLEGVCSKCGSAFAWHDAFHPPELMSPRHVEHCPRRKIVSAAWRTWTWTILPWKFWQRVGLQNELRPKRLLAWFLIVILGSHLLTAMVGIVAMGIMRHEELAAIRQIGFDILRPDIWIVHSLIVPMGSYYTGSMAVIVGLRFNAEHWSLGANLALAVSVTMPIVLTALGRFNERVAIPRKVLVRATVFGFAWMLVPICVRLLIEMEFLFGWMLPWSEENWRGPVEEFLMANWHILALGLPVWAIVWWTAMLRSVWPPQGRSALTATALSVTLFVGLVFTGFARPIEFGWDFDLRSIVNQYAERTNAPAHIRSYQRCGY